MREPIAHMEKCCPDILAEARSDGGLLGKCWMGSKLCEVPGYVHETAKQRKKRQAREMRERSHMDMIKLMSSLGMTSLGPPGCFDDGARYDFGGDDDDFEGDQTEVEFLRPDGDMETKSVQWFLDHKFFEVEKGLWSGPWYYNDKKKNVELESSLGRKITTFGDSSMFEEEVPKITFNMQKKHNCKECSRAFQTFYLAHQHMKKCCPHKLAPNISAKDFAVDRSWYECSLCYPTQKFANEADCLEHIATTCPSYPRFSSCQPDTFVMPKPRQRFPCANCGKEHAKWNKCLEHMWICCPAVIFAENIEGEMNAYTSGSSLQLNPDAADFKPANAN